METIKKIWELVPDITAVDDIDLLLSLGITLIVASLVTKVFTKKVVKERHL